MAAWARRRWPTGPETSLDALLEPGFVAIDLETTGLDARRDDVVAIAAIPFPGGEAAPGYVTLVNPGRPIPPAATRVHGIADTHVLGAPTLDEVLPQFDAICGDRVLVGHDVGFDVTLLRHARRRRGLPVPAVVALDSRRLAVAVHPGWRHRAELEFVAAQLSVPVRGRHTAEGDARMAGAILLALLPELRRRGVCTLRALSWAQTAVYRHT
jgi:DNA polymerase III epsilon subunit family exonuclease